MRAGGLLPPTIMHILAQQKVLISQIMGKVVKMWVAKLDVGANESI